MGSVNKELKQQFAIEASEILAKNLKEVYLDNLVDETCTDDLTEEERYVYQSEMRKAVIRASKALGVDYTNLTKPTKPATKRERQFTVPHCKDCRFFTSKGNCVELLSRYGFKGGFGKPASHGCMSFNPHSMVADRYQDVLKEIEAKKSCTLNQRS